MIDIHCHILPGVDDGSKNLSESIEMAKIAYDEGIRTIINTSHYHTDFKYKKGKELNKVLNDFNKALKVEGIDLNIILGNELYYTEDLFENFENLDFYSLNSSRYLLIEFSPNNFPKNIVDIVYEIKLRGYIPVLAHVERYPKVQENPNLIYDCINEGALIQVNASSITGKNGTEAQKTSDILLKNKMIHFIATDAHSSTRRRPLIKEAYEYVSQKYSRELAEKLFLENQKVIIENTELEIEIPSMYEKKKSFLKRLFKR
ncbi:putative tyrosine-protein phosphatase CapC [[Clostridium] sordellii]|uniref:tyrosine-protein phosphatase n=1 Tax=Paraclostridium sordellii TaxID=1505 RepID=UPI0005E319A3|nr:CpsB/CapC family capsule biosynthesis tyrosine phosphatase [Paeniclostridium sordellii]MDU1454633.1 CpsB/CapC family capsule biosynthesis tyrosine phosphatase [Paeniclostridium sordellii]CEO10629.1 putative tyrosine-protein phosphatase CapC [[Clostridium] sordellii] [Paeniclostridium sordellii]